MTKRTFRRFAQAIKLLVACAATTGIFVSAPALAATRTITIVGYLENAIIPLRGIPDLSIKAKMDSGAYMTSIHAVDIKRYTRNGRKWVSFLVKVSGRKIRFRRRLVQTINIQRAGVSLVERPVVRIGICIAGYYRLAKVNLTDRSRMNFPLLVGRLFMAPGRLVIDSANTYQGTPVCSGAP